ncbi:rhomboid family intramembrane serine protease [Oculatella sp. FACHB-28]|uniref:rhomboid family intramembrane serine protease n=1 Tax=Cyanophyceae TaxID=3028117 RepID=UPI0016854194|nr:rhomboid family intramembrane serine protease [Cyanobacteria bacterium FACHB-471]MBD1996919.1 rhomboid family intramembrane serine protease [Leptolyngbya sp. FACHB-541]MBD2055368.1 rhomboid family intramembrane serine protease [Oculatella sp. FACHB-28]MBD2067506.1 rhomboid family intramembrane serine protease [Leptolyngbya sp. FACHB-671]
MVPLRDDNPTQITPYVTYGLILLNILVFFYEASLSPPALEAFFRGWAVVPAELTASFQGQATSATGPEWLTLITSQFLHGGFLHLGGNMLYLWIFGNNVEERLGRVKYLIFYLLCGILASLAQWYFAQGSNIPSLGASGAIAGVMGAYILRFPQAKVLTLIPLGFLLYPIRIPALFFLGIWFGQQALYGLVSLNAPTNIGMESGGIAYWAHAGGFVVGAVLGPLFGLFSDAGKAPARRYR